MTTRLVTIPFSHYCDKARWALERAGVPFTEVPHAPLFHSLFAVRAGGRRTVPVLVAGGRSLTDSTDILKWADEQLPAGRRLFTGDPVVDELEHRFDEKLGPATRRWAYFHILQDRDRSVRLLGMGSPRWEQRATRLVFPLLRRIMRRVMNITAESAQRSLERVVQIFDEVDSRLADGRRYLSGDRFSAADLAFATLSAPVVLPPSYAARLLPLEELPAEVAAQIALFRARPAGAFALRLYEERVGPTPP